MTDGTMKSFLVTQSQTPNAVKFMVCKKMGLDVKEFNMFGLYTVDGDSNGTLQRDPDSRSRLCELGSVGIGSRYTGDHNGGVAWCILNLKFGIGSKEEG